MTLEEKIRDNLIGYPFVYMNGTETGTEIDEKDLQETIGYLLALIKDLVQKCKPEEKHSIHPMTTTANARNNGYNLAIKQFEQNILKALEEK